MHFHGFKLSFSSCKIKFELLKMFTTLIKIFNFLIVNQMVALNNFILFKLRHKLIYLAKLRLANKRCDITFLFFWALYLGKIYRFDVLLDV